AVVALTPGSALWTSGRFDLERAFRSRVDVFREIADAVRELRLGEFQGRPFACIVDHDLIQQLVRVPAGRPGRLGGRRVDTDATNSAAQTRRGLRGKRVSRNRSPRDESAHATATDDRDAQIGIVWGLSRHT